MHMYSQTAIFCLLTRFYNPDETQKNKVQVDKVHSADSMNPANMRDFFIRSYHFQMHFWIIMLINWDNPCTFGLSVCNLISLAALMSSISIIQLLSQIIYIAQYSIHFCQSQPFIHCLILIHIIRTLIIDNVFLC